MSGSIYSKDLQQKWGIQWVRASNTEEWNAFALQQFGKDAEVQATQGRAGQGVVHLGRYGRRGAHGERRGGSNSVAKVRVGGVITTYRHGKV